MKPKKSFNTQPKLNLSFRSFQEHLCVRLKSHLHALTAEEAWVRLGT